MKINSFKEWIFLVFLFLNLTINPNIARAEEQKSKLDQDIENLLYGSVMAKRTAALSLSHYRDKRALIALLEGLQQEDSNVRLNSAWSLGQIGDRSVVQFLIERLDDKELTVRNQVIRSLGLIRDKRCIKPLLDLLKNDSSEVIQISIIQALSQIRDKSVLRPLIDCLYVESAKVRAEAANALGQFEDNRVVKFLMDVYQNDKDLNVRQNAALALRRLGTLVDIPSEKDSSVKPN